MFLYTEKNYVVDLKGFLANNRRKKSQECGVLDFFTQILLADNRQTRIKTQPQFGLILAVYLCACNRNFALAQNLLVVRSAF